MVEEVDDNVLFSRWSEVPDPAKTLVVSKLDYKTRRSLRACSRKDHEIVDTFLFFKIESMFFGLTEITDADGVKSYELKHGVIDRTSEVHDFEKAEQMAGFLQNILKNIESFENLSLLINGMPAPIQMTRNFKKINVNTLHLSASCDPEVVNALVGQIDPRFLEQLYLRGQSFDVAGFGPFKLQRFFSLQSSQISDAQLLSITSRQVDILNATRLTVAGLNQFMKKMLRDGETQGFFCTDLSAELTYLFDRRKRSESSCIHLTAQRSGRLLRLFFDDTPHRDLTVIGEIVQRRYPFHGYPSIIGLDLREFIQSIEFDY